MAMATEPPPLSFPQLQVDLTKVGTVDAPLPNADEDEDDPWIALDRAAFAKAEYAASTTSTASKRKRTTVVSPLRKRDRMQRFDLPGPCVVDENVVLRVKFSNAMRVPVYMCGIRAVGTIDDDDNGEEWKTRWVGGAKHEQRFVKGEQGH